MVRRLIGAPRPSGAPPVRVIDVGVGSGAVAVTLAVLLRRRRMLDEVALAATDLSDDALQLARENAVAHAVGDRIEFSTADLLPGAEWSRWDVVLANLPYVRTEAIPSLPIAASFEPAAALDGGPDGLRVIGAAARPAPGRARPRRRRAARDRRRPGGRPAGARRGAAARAGRARSSWISAGCRASRSCARAARAPADGGPDRCHFAGSPTAPRAAPRRPASLEAGGLVAFPTDTVYGIAVALETPGGIERLFAAKQRPPDKAIALLLADAAQAAEIGELTRRGDRARARLLAGRADARRSPPRGSCRSRRRSRAASSRPARSRRSACASRTTRRRAPSPARSGRCRRRPRIAPASRRRATPTRSRRSSAPRST